MVKISDWIILFSRWERLIVFKILNEVCVLVVVVGVLVNGWVGLFMVIESYLILCDVGDSRMCNYYLFNIFVKCV